ncbi:MAG TPA: hypothetical protein VHN14_05225, partial [Kofleriaceae bacterium]|nr:hypothetical protein [Kofleriaceae bacterium]
CTYCNKCLGQVLKNPLGCYEESRFDSYDAMIQEIMSVFEPQPYIALGSPGSDDDAMSAQAPGDPGIVRLRASGGEGKP